MLQSPDPAQKYWPVKQCPYNPNPSLIIISDCLNVAPRQVQNKGKKDTTMITTNRCIVY